MGLVKGYEELALKGRASTMAILDKAFAANSSEVLVSLSNFLCRSRLSGDYRTAWLGQSRRTEWCDFHWKTWGDAKLLADAFEQATH